MICSLELVDETNATAPLCIIATDELLAVPVAVQVAAQSPGVPELLAAQLAVEATARFVANSVAAAPVGAERDPQRRQEARPRIAPHGESNVCACERGGDV